MGGTTSMFYSGAVEAAAGTIVSGAVSSITSGYEMEEGLDVTLYSLQHEVSKIKSAIEAARGRRITNQMLLKWLAQIIDATYLGEYYYRTFKNQSSHPPVIASTEGTSNLLINYPTIRAAKRQRTIKTLLFGNDVHRELHDVLKMLKSIDMCVFLQMVNALPERPMKRYLYMDHTWLIDRGKEREQVMKFLFEPSMAGENNVDILPIVGSKGVGTTTLALHCFYDPKVQNHFSLKIYIPRSVTYYPNDDIPMIFKQILKQCNKTQKNNYDENTLLAMIKQNLSSERLLLVMDEVVSIDSTVWNDLLGCLRCGKQGSKVIFASVICDCPGHKNIRDAGTVKPLDAGTVKPLMLEGISEDEYMLFFREHAFGSADPEDFPKLAKMGEEIAKKMNGSIWGAKIIGELLRDNLNAPFWSSFLRDGFLSSEFLHCKDLHPVVKTISKLLPNCLQMKALIWGESWKLLHLINKFKVKSFRELMVLGPRYCSPVIMKGMYCGVPFLVAKHVNLYESIFFAAICQPIGDERKIFLLEDRFQVSFQTLTKVFGLNELN